MLIGKVWWQGEPRFSHVDLLVKLVLNEETQDHHTIKFVAQKFRSGFLGTQKIGFLKKGGLLKRGLFSKGVVDKQFGEIGHLECAFENL